MGPAGGVDVGDGSSSPPVHSQTVRRSGPPHISVLSPWQGILQPLEADAPLPPKEFPQKHSCAYSVPAYLKPADRQAA